MLWLLLRRKILTLRNSAGRLSPWERCRNAAFILMGLGMLLILYASFWRLLKFLDSVPIIGELLLWKLTALATLTTFSMVALSSLITSLTTLFYAEDLPLLVRSPLPPWVLFLDKSLEVAFFSSWMIAMALLPYILALSRAKGLGWPFLVAFAVELLPFLALAAAAGMAFTLSVMYLIPSPRTRDILWILSSLGITSVYLLARLAEPERLVRPDFLQWVTQYIDYLQAPTAPYLPSWWLARGLWGYAHARWDTFRDCTLMLYGVCSITYGILTWAAGRLYLQSYSGAQEGRRWGRGQNVEASPEARWARRLKAGRELAALFWKERTTFFRDVKHWSQIAMIAALVCVYLFSIHRLPLDTPDLKSLVCFLNLGVAGFVIASLGLRFTFPSISLEGKNFWLVRSAPVRLESLMRQKFLFTFIPMASIAVTLVLASNSLLRADPFIARLSMATIVAMTVSLCAMGVGLGALFPKFEVANIHQIESSAGGFVYMAACLAFIAITVGVEAAPVHMHFQSRLGRAQSWDFLTLAACALSLLLLHATAIVVPWRLGRRSLERYEA